MKKLSIFLLVILLLSVGLLGLSSCNITSEVTATYDLDGEEFETNIAFGEEVSYDGL